MGDRQVWKTLTFRVRVKTSEFEVLADAVSGELYRSLKETHGCELKAYPVPRVNGKIINFRSSNAKR